MGRTFEHSDRLLRVTLSDPQERQRELDLHFRIFDTPIARRWSEVVVFLSARSACLHHPERFYNFPGDPKASKEWIHGEIERCIEGVHRFSPGFVDVRPSLAMEQPVLNELHERFAHGVDDLVETRTVVDLSRSPRPIAAWRSRVRDPEALAEACARVRAHCGRDAEAMSFPEMLGVLDDHPAAGEVIAGFVDAFEPEGRYFQDMNIAIHRWEDFCAVQAHQARYGESWKSFSINYYPNRCIEMRSEDYPHFTIQQLFGRVYLEDMTAGKCIWDVYRDQDEAVADEHFKTLGYYWGDARFYFGPDQDDELVEAQLAEFWKWFAANETRLGDLGFFRDDPELTVGALPVADLEPRGPLAGLDPTGIVEAVSRHQRVEAVAVVGEDGEPLRSSPFVQRFGGWRDVFRAFGPKAESAGRYE